MEGVAERFHQPQDILRHLVVASMTLVVKIIAAAKEMEVAGYFGTSGVI